MASSELAAPAAVAALPSYREAIALDREFVPAAPPARSGMFDHIARRALEVLGADPAFERLGLRPRHRGELTRSRPRALLRAALTARPPGPLPHEAVPLLDALLGGLRRGRRIIDPARLPDIAETLGVTVDPEATRVVLWRGDITDITADAIVNAASNTLLGCFQPGHVCIDNAVHSAAGPRLREDCFTVAELTGTPEYAGSAKITRGYHLSARYVVHAVGPVVEDTPLPRHRDELAAAYRSSLDLAASFGAIRTVALSPISQGDFALPRAETGRIAVRTVAEWIQTHPGRFDRVVFDVCGDEDYRQYTRHLGEWPAPH
ncbi:macro domain-containing protein [Nocardia sp. NPDC050406]|uniref:macro domain-containing protein n=1 Tax=Nocardia sp. NPDC050406 TaxID=3364318 RepID=UPI0037AA0C61